MAEGTQVSLCPARIRSPIQIWSGKGDVILYDYGIHGKRAGNPLGTSAHPHLNFPYDARNPL